MSVIYLAGGCFWGTEKLLSLLRGVISTEVGYANGNKENPTYEEVCNDSGHAEVVKIEYDESIVSLAFLLEIYFESINPVSMNCQGEDCGIQYRTGIYFVEDTDLEVINASITKLQLQYEERITIEVKLLENFYKAEAYHQKYLDKNPSGYCHISPLLMKKAAEANKG